MGWGYSRREQRSLRVSQSDNKNGKTLLTRLDQEIAQLARR